MELKAKIAAKKKKIWEEFSWDGGLKEVTF